jgi:phosphatidate cytidylyltransferase
VTTAQDKSSKWSDLAVRSASGLVMAVLAFAMIWHSRTTMLIFFGVVSCLVFWEWCAIVKLKPSNWGWILLGALYSTLPMYILYLISRDRSSCSTGFVLGSHQNDKIDFFAISNIGIQFHNAQSVSSCLSLSCKTLTYDFAKYVIILLMALTIATDVGAYFAGRIFGGPKLAPRLSPKKTWAGVYGAIFLTIITWLLVNTFRIYLNLKTNEKEWMTEEGFWNIVQSIYFANNRLFYAAIFCVLFVLIAQGGDIFESWFKRKFGVKDSSNLIPGHGGVMDRVDGFFAVLILFVPIAVVAGYYIDRIPKMYVIEQ